MKVVSLRGRVFSGKGEGAKYVSLDWAKRQMKEKLGFDPYPGTLDIRLCAVSLKNKRLLMKSSGLEITPATGYYPGKLFRATIGNVTCAIVIPEVPGYSEEIIEVIAPTDLRRTLCLADDNMIEVQVTF